MQSNSTLATINSLAFFRNFSKHSYDVHGGLPPILPPTLDVSEWRIYSPIILNYK